MEEATVSRLLLAIPATCILALLFEYLRRNYGARRALVFLGVCALYGLVRGSLVSAISASHQVPMPYRMAGSVRIGDVSPMEIAGWLLAAAVAWQLGAKLWGRFGRAPGSELPFRTAFAGAFVLAALCLAVETAAIAAGWWTWSIPPPPEQFLRVPVVALFDWAFVAFDFLLPFLLFLRPARTLDRAVALALFPLHFASHRYLHAPFPSIALSFYDLAHVTIPAWVLWRAAAEQPAAERARKEWGAFLPGIAALLVALDTAVTVWLARQPAHAIFVAPLAAVGLMALLSGRLAKDIPRGTAAALLRRTMQTAAVLLGLAVLLFVRLPMNRTRDAYAADVQAGVERFNAGDSAGAAARFAAAVALRPDKAEPHLLHALALHDLGRNDEARRALDEAVRLKPALAGSNEAAALRRALDAGP